MLEANSTVGFYKTVGGKYTKSFEVKIGGVKLKEDMYSWKGRLIHSITYILFQRIPKCLKKTACRNFQRSMAT